MLARVLTALLLGIGIALAPAARAEPVPSPDTVERFAVKSRVMGEERPILVRTPEGYKGSTERYPVLYLTDGDGHLRHTSASIAYLAGLSQVPEMIVVAIPNTDRSRDLSPATPQGEAGVPPSSPGGGADRFLRFIESELMPEVDRRFRTAPYRILAGHSLGGLFAVHALLARPELFQAYFAVSPALARADQEILRRAEKRFREPGEWKKTLFLSLGDETGGMRQAFDRLTTLLTEQKPRGLTWHAVRMEDQDHASVVPGSYFAALRRLFAGWSVRLDPTTGLVPGGLPAVDAHYRQLSERFGYPIRAPELLLNTLGYRYVVKGDLDAAISVFKAVLELYPQSANAHDSLGDAYERKGDLELARKHFSEAVSLARKREDPDLGTFRANLERVLGKLK